VDSKAFQARWVKLTGIDLRGCRSRVGLFFAYFRAEVIHTQIIKTPENRANLYGFAYVSVITCTPLYESERLTYTQTSPLAHRADNKYYVNLVYNEIGVQAVQPGVCSCIMRLASPAAVGVIARPPQCERRETFSSLRGRRRRPKQSHFLERVFSRFIRPWLAVEPFITPCVSS